MKLKPFEEFEKDFVVWYTLQSWVDVEHWTRTRALYEYFKYLHTLETDLF